MCAIFLKNLQGQNEGNFTRTIYAVSDFSHFFKIS